MKSRAFLELSNYEDQITRIIEERHYIREDIVDNNPTSEEQEQLDILISREMCLQDKVEMRKEELEMFEILISDHFEKLKDIAKKIVT